MLTLQFAPARFHLWYWSCKPGPLPSGCDKGGSIASRQVGSWADQHRLSEAVSRIGEVTSTSHAPRVTRHFFLLELRSRGCRGGSQIGSPCYQKTEHHRHAGLVSWTHFWNDGNDAFEDYIWRELCSIDAWCILRSIPILCTMLSRHPFEWEVRLRELLHGSYSST